MSSEECAAELARRFFTWIGPATVAEFQEFAGLGVKAAKAAVEPLKLAPIEEGSAYLMFPKDREAWQAFKTPKQPRYVLISSLDAISLLRRDLKTLLADEDQDQKVPTEKGSAAMGGLAYLPSHAILDRGTLAGLWEYDPSSASIAWMAFRGRNKEMEKAVRETEAYVRDQLGDARSFSLDSPASRAPRIEALRKAKN
jgi:hypothetical protein